MSFFDNYDIKNPNLVMDILNYFSLGSDSPQSKSVLKFCERYSIPNTNNNGCSFSVQPNVVNKICEILCNKNHMSCIRTDGLLGLENSYIVSIQDIEQWQNDKKRLSIYFNSIVYGFNYIYKLYKDIVVPIVYESMDGDISVGTGFKFNNGIATARHCLEGAKSISIKGYSKEELNGKNIYVSKNENIDIAFIDINKIEDIHVYPQDGSIMQSVLTMGYPKVPAFTDFLTAELATISSIAERMTPTVGSIAALSKNIFTKMELMLITAKIRGGNSGGPVISDNGSVVGIASQIPFYEGNYDDLGYGIVVPIKYLIEIINFKESVLEVKDNYFTDFIE